MAKKELTERQQIISDLVEQGIDRRTARAHADKVLAERDRVVVEKNGAERPAPIGPEL